MVSAPHTPSRYRQTGALAAIVRSCFRNIGSFWLLSSLSCSLVAPDDSVLSRDVPTLSCPTDEKRCGIGCVSIRQRCPEDTRWLDCDQEIDTGQEVDSYYDPKHCGDCGTECDAGDICEKGTCVQACKALRSTATHDTIRVASTGFGVAEGDFTLDQWLYIERLEISYGFLTNGTRFGNALSIRFAFESGSGYHLTVEVSPAGGYTPENRALFQVPFAVGHWFHLAVQRKDSWVTLFLDGKAWPQKDKANAPIFELGDAFIGAPTNLPKGTALLLIGPTRFSRSARYDGDFVPDRVWPVDKNTVGQWLTSKAPETRLLPGSKDNIQVRVLLDEAGNLDGFANDGIIEDGWLDAAELSPCAPSMMPPVLQ